MLPSCVPYFPNIRQYLTDLIVCSLTFTALVEALCLKPKVAGYIRGEDIENFQLA